jgi:phosphatidate cytidylyltransferase
MNNFTKRALTALVFVSVLIGCIYFNHFWFSLLFLFFSIVGMWEFYSISLLGENNPQKYVGIVIGSCLFIAFSLISSGAQNGMILFYFIPAFYLIFVIELFRKNKNPFRNIAFTILGVIYVAIPFGLLNFIAVSRITGDYEPGILMGIFLILWASDTGAYLVGSRIGKRKLFERISPKKSWEGSFGGALLSLIAAYLNAKLFTILPTKTWFVIALIVVIMGTLGDLVESLYKRSKNVKDSGTLLPGHGGILDRFDSLLLATPFIYSYLEWTKNLF